MRKVIRADGYEFEIEDKKTMDHLRQIIGADTLDSVMLADRVHVMLLDDIGHDKELPVNAKATALYHARCIPGTSHQIRGDVVIVPDSDFA